MAHAFRFGALEYLTGSGQQWTETVRRIEGSGFSTLEIIDHLGTAQLAPLPALAAAAAVTTTLRLGTQVLCNDYRHPIVLAKECATLDVLSNGRLELGIGAGWMLDDYTQSGIPLDPPGVRISRLEESLTILKRCFADQPVTFTGKHYDVRAHDSMPKPVQSPHPPILIGGGAQRMLRLAGREADIVGINFDLRSDTTRAPNTPAAGGLMTAAAARTGTSEEVDQKIAWVREEARDRFDQLEFNITGFVTRVTDDVAGTAADIGARIGLSAKETLDIPFVLIGPPERIIDTLVERRERFGINYWTFPMARLPNAYEVLAPVIERLAGT
jgi:probable F420-dependent oxidoreductase